MTESKKVKEKETPGKGAKVEKKRTGSGRKTKAGELVNTPYAEFVEEIMRSRIRVARDVIRCVLPPELQKYLDLSVLKVEKDTYVDEILRRRHLDVLYRTRLALSGFPLFILFEHKSTLKPFEALDQGRGYQNLLYDEEVNIPVLNVLLHHTRERRRNAPLDFKKRLKMNEEERRGLSGDLMGLRIRVLDAGDPDLEKRVVFPLTKLFFRVLREIRYLSDEKRLIEFLKSSKDVFIGDKTGFVEKVLIFIYRAHGVKPEKMRELLEQYVHKEMGKMAMTTAEILREEGLKEGKKERELEIAGNMLADGQSVQYVMKMTGLTKKELEGAGLLQKAG